MKAESLYDNLAKLGLPFLTPSEKVDVNRTVAEVVKSRDMRLWEGLPVLLKNAADRKEFSVNKVERELNREERKFLHNLLLLALALYALKNQESTWSNNYKANLPDNEKKTVKQWRDNLAHAEPVAFSGQEFSPSRLLKNFDLYFSEADASAKKKNERHAQLSLEYALSQLFSPKQKELFKKKLDGQALTKTEQEYYSRTVRKKVAALANAELHSMARRLLE